MTTKFNIGDTVFFFEKGKIKSGMIEAIYTFISADRELVKQGKERKFTGKLVNIKSSITYALFDLPHRYYEEEFFRSTQDLKNYLVSLDV